MSHSGNLTMIKSIFHDGVDVDVNRKNDIGDTALILAAKNGSFQIGKSIICVSILTKQIFIRSGHQEIAEFLIKNGADISAQNKYNLEYIHAYNKGNF